MVLKKFPKITLGIVIDTALTLPPNTGVTYRLYYLSKKLTEKGIKVKLFLCNRNIINLKAAKKLFEKSKIEYHIIPLKIFYSISDLKKILEDNSLNILQFEDAVSLLRYENIAKELNIPVCLEMHDVEATLKLLLGHSKREVNEATKISHVASGLAEKIVCMTKQDYNELIKIIKVDKEKIELIPNPIDVKHFLYGRKYSNTYNICFIGNMYYWPNQNAVKLIAKKIYSKVVKKNSKIKFYIIGMAPKSLRDEFNKKNFIFTGVIKNLNTYFRKIDIALCPVVEGSGMKVKILNYCAAGLPIITTKIGASGYEQVKSLIIEDNLDKYSDLILKLLENKGKLYNIGRLNRKYITRYYNIEKIADNMVKIYKKLLTKDKHRCSRSKIKIKLNLPLWLEEKRIKSFNNNTYYIIKNGKIIYKKIFA